MTTDASMLTAKVALLEQIVAWLVIREMNKEADPVLAATNFSENLQRVIERNASGDGSKEEEVAKIISSEVAHSLFDRVLAAVQAQNRPR